MNTPQRTPIETKIANFRTARLAGAAAIVALVAMVENRCDSFIENFHEDAGTTSDASKDDENVDADAGTFVQKASKETVDVGASSPYPKGELHKDAIDKVIWDKMNALADALLKAYPPSPEPTRQEDDYGDDRCKNADRVAGRLNIRRETERDDTQILAIASGIPGCNGGKGGNMLSIHYEHSGGNLRLVINESVLDRETSYHYLSSSPSDIQIVTELVAAVDEYHRGQERLDGAAWNADTDHSRSLESCRLQETYRARSARIYNEADPLPPAADPDDAEDLRTREEIRQGEEQDRGNEKCGKN